MPLPLEIGGRRQNESASQLLMNPIGFIEIVSSPDLLHAERSDGDSPYAVDKVEVP
jgi:hypothetical protein